MLIAGSVRPGRADEPSVVPGGDAPLLRIESDGPLSRVTALAFSPNGRVLYSGGWDKVVRVWRYDGERFVHDAQAVYRVPVGGGLDGGITALAVSDDGRWLAVGGRGAKRGIAGQRDIGYVVPGGSMSPEMWQDEGQIYVYDTTNRQARVLRGHPGGVVTLQFAPTHPDKPPLLCSAASTFADGAYKGEVILWNVAEGDAVGTLRDLPEPNPTFTPRLLAWHSGAGVESVKVAITWGISGFGCRVWDVLPDVLGKAEPEDKAVYVSLLPHSEAAAMTVSNRPTLDTGQLGVWSLPTGPLVDLSRSRDYRLLRQFPSLRLPMAAAVFQHGGQSYIAVVVTDWEQRAARLVVLSGDGQRQVAEHPLWDGVRVPALAATPGGDHVALTPGDSQSILTFDVASLLQPGARPQRLESTLPRFNAVTFVRKQESLGLKVRPEGDGLGPFVFDLTEARVVPDEAGWKADKRPQRGWAVRHEALENKTVRVRITRPDGSTQSMDVDCPDSVTGTPTNVLSAISPSAEDVPVPVLVLAFDCGGQPRLQVYNLETAEHVRTLTAHTGRIRALSVSGDGRFVASLAEDRTVRVWRLSDLVDHLGARGLLREGNKLAKVVERDGRLVVTEGVSGLQPEMVIQSVTESSEERPLMSAWGLYEYVHFRRPGEPITLNVQAGGQSRAVTLRVGQAIDEQKPLFSLSFLPRRREEGWDWIGWNPLGPFDSSGAEAEQHLGWHFNTGEPGAPTRFAAAGEYREAFYTPGLIEHLLTHESLPERQVAAPPRLSLLIQDADGNGLEPDFADEILLRSPIATAALQVSGRFPLRHAESVTARLQTVGQVFNLPPAAQRQVTNLPHGGDEVSPPISATRTSDAEWALDLSSLDWSRGHYRLLVTLATNEAEPRTFETAANIRFQPPGPDVTVDPVVSPTQQPTVPLTIRVSPAEGVDAKLVLLQRDVDGNLISNESWNEGLSGDRPLEHRLALKEGINRIELVAVNKRPLYQFEAAEMTRRFLEITYSPAEMPAEAPTIALQEIVAGGRHFPLGADVPIPALEAPDLQLRGIVKAAAPIQRAVVALGEQEAPLNGVRAGATGEISFTASVKLQPGSQVVRIVAQSQGGGRHEQQIELAYKPSVPTFTKFRVETAENGTAQLSAHLVAPPHAYPFQIRVLVDGAPQEDVPVDVRDGQVTATVPLDPGEHRLQLRASNEWNVVQSSFVATAAFLRVPRIVRIEAAAEVDEPRLDRVVIETNSPQELPIDADTVGLTVNGQSLPVRAEVRAGGEDVWLVTLTDVPLNREGRNTLQFTVANAEGRTPTAAVHEVFVKSPPVPGPEIRIISPADQAKVTVPRVTLEFTIDSPSPLSDVRISVDRRSLGGVLPSAEEGRRRVYRRPLDLLPGVNRIEVLAVNGGGPAQAAIEVAYTPLPLRVQVQRLGSLTPLRRDEHLGFGQALGDSQATLGGYVEWDDAERAPEFAQFWVNGFMQQAVRLEEMESFANRRRFEVNLFFNRRSDNTVQVNVPGFAVDRASEEFRTFLVDCERPRADQELYLLIIGAAAPQTEGMTPDEHARVMAVYEESLTRRALGALKARTGADEHLQAPSFGEIHSPIVLTGRRAVYRKINSALGLLKSKIRPPSRRRDAEPSHTVLMVYYHGKEVRVEERGQETFVLATTETWDDPAANLGDSISNAYLTSMLGRFYGAHVLFLDVQSPTLQPESNWPADPHLGIIRTVWTDPDQLPETPPLISAMEKVMPQSRYLQEIVSGLRANLLSEDRPVLSDFNIPAMLNQLELGGSGGAGG